MKKSIFEYENYREFLRDAYADHKAKNKHFSFRYFARIAGFKACNVLKLVMDGKRNIAPYSIGKFAKALKLNKEESVFFKNLVLFNQAEKSEERLHFAQEMMKCRRFREIYPIKESQFNFYQNWYFTPIRELVNLPDFQEHYDWIAARLTPPITASEARRAIEELLKLGLIAYDSKGRLQQTHEHIATADEVSSVAVATFHRQMLKLASESIDRVDRSKRDISAQTFGTSDETAKKIKEKIQNFRKELIQLIDQDKGVPNCIYQLNFQLFPLAEAREGSEE